MGVYFNINLSNFSMIYNLLQTRAKFIQALLSFAQIRLHNSVKSSNCRSAYQVKASVFISTHLVVECLISYIIASFTSFLLNPFSSIWR